MEATLRKTGALLSKDLKDLVKNPSALVMCLLPIAFVLLYTFMFSEIGAGDPEGEATVSHFMLSMSFPFATGTVCTITATSAIAEEREKHTLRTLMLANVGAGHIVASRAITTLVAITLVDAACYLIIGPPLESMAACILIGVLGSLPLVLISLLLGLVARDQMTAGVYSLPVLIIAIAPMFGSFIEGASDFLRFLPTGGMDALVNLAVAGNLFSSDAVLPIAVTLAWIVASAAAFALLFKRLTRDN